MGLVPFDEARLGARGFVALGPADPTAFEGFTNKVEACAVEIGTRAEERKDVLSKRAEREREREQRKQALRRERRERKQQKQAQRRERRGTYFHVRKGISSVLSPLAKPLVKAGGAVTARYSDYSFARKQRKYQSKEQKGQKELEQFKSLYNEIHPTVLKMQTLSVQPGSSFEVFENHTQGTVYFSMVEKTASSVEQVTNLVVLALNRKGRIKIYGNCNAYKSYMGKEASRRVDVNNSDSMDMMYWNATGQEPLFYGGSATWSKFSMYERYRGFDKRAVSLITGRVNPRVVKQARRELVRMVVSQGLYSPNKKGETCTL